VPSVNASTMQFLAWVAQEPRSYAETIEIWRTSCPRLAVWEDALADDLVRVDTGLVRLTPTGREGRRRGAPALPALERPRACARSPCGEREGSGLVGRRHVRTDGAGRQVSRLISSEGQTT
jgi:hypothetical protein